MSACSDASPSEEAEEAEQLQLPQCGTHLHPLGCGTSKRCGGRERGIDGSSLDAGDIAPASIRRLTRNDRNARLSSLRRIACPLAAPQLKFPALRRVPTAWKVSHQICMSPSNATRGRR